MMARLLILAQPRFQSISLQKLLIMKMIKFFIASLLFCFSLNVPAAESFDGLNLDLGNLYRVSNAQSRSIGPESFTGEKGRAGMATEGTGKNAARDLGQGWKISPSVRVGAHATFTLADITGPGAIQQIWMTPAPLDKTRWNIIRIYWDDDPNPSVECPMGDFFACGWGR